MGTDRESTHAPNLWRHSEELKAARGKLAQFGHVLDARDFCAEQNRVNWARPARRVIDRGIGISRMHFYDMMNEKKPISPEVAAHIGRYFGNGGEIWLTLQQRYDLAAIEREKADELNAIRVAERVPEKHAA